jgi:hypothetical protein
LSAREGRKKGAKSPPGGRSARRGERLNGRKAGAGAGPGTRTRRMEPAARFRSGRMAIAGAFFWKNFKGLFSWKIFLLQNASNNGIIINSPKLVRQ